MNAKVVATLVAAAVVVGGPAMAAVKKDDTNKMICRKQQPNIGTRLGARRVCATAAEWKMRDEEIASEAKRNVDKIQQQRALNSQ